MNNALIIFIKNPVAGQVKTRLAESIGDNKALRVYKQLLKYTRNLTDYLQSDKLLFYSDFIDKDDDWDNAIYSKNLQTGNDLGEKMLNAFVTTFHLGYKKAVIIGSDCVELTREIIENAFYLLETNDVVIGPAKDGGYYLLGMNQLYPEIFKEKSWSAPKLLNETIRTIKEKGLNYQQLQVLNDIDELKDLILYQDMIKAD